MPRGLPGLETATLSVPFINALERHDKRGGANRLVEFVGYRFRRRDFLFCCQDRARDQAVARESPGRGAVVLVRPNFGNRPG